MAEVRELFRVELLNLADLVKLPPSSVTHHIRPLTVKPAKIGAQNALEILKAKPGGPEVIAQLRQRGKLKGLTLNPGETIGYSDPMSGDPWSARNAEVSGPSVNSLMFCCTDGPNGSWQSNFTMPALDDFMAMVHVAGGAGSVSATLDGVSMGSYPFSGEDWIVVPVMDLAAGLHTFGIKQENAYFFWLSTEYIRL